MSCLLASVKALVVARDEGFVITILWLLIESFFVFWIFWGVSVLAGGVAGLHCLCE